jgi:RNA polymerase sigma-70 factor, ECF subfamily
LKQLKRARTGQTNLLVNAHEILLSSAFIMSAVSNSCSAPTDVDLAIAMSRGDAQALAHLYDRFAPAMLGLARRIAVTPEIAEDLVHEVFLEAWEHAADYDPKRGSVRAWLLLRTRSRCIDHRRSAQQSRTRSVDDYFWTSQVSTDGVESPHHPDYAMIRAELLKLPDEQRDALLLGYFEGLSSSEIAAQLGSPIGTIKTRVAAALGKLRCALVEQNRGDHGA